jgi:hypothetical protein
MRLYQAIYILRAGGEKQSFFVIANDIPDAVKLLSDEVASGEVSVLEELKYIATDQENLIMRNLEPSASHASL